jgi:hypothetical protein
MLNKNEGFEIAKKAINQKQKKSGCNDFSAIELH